MLGVINLFSRSCSRDSDDRSVRLLYARRTSTDLCWLGMERTDQSSRHEKYDQQMRSKYLTPMQSFSARIDQLLVALDRVKFQAIIAPPFDLSVL